MKKSMQADGTEALEQLSGLRRRPPLLDADQRGSAARRRSVQHGGHQRPRPAVPGLSARRPAARVYPLVPLFTNQALGIALFSYDGGFFWGFNADWDAVPDLHVFVEGLEEEFELLRKL